MGTQRLSFPVRQVAQGGEVEQRSDHIGGDEDGQIPPLRATFVVEHQPLAQPGSLVCVGRQPHLVEGQVDQGGGDGLTPGDLSQPC